MSPLPKKRENCKALFFPPFSFLSLYILKEFTQITQIIVTIHILIDTIFFLLQFRRKWVPDSFSSCTSYDVTKVRLCLQNWVVSPFFSGLGFCKRLSLAGSSILCGDGADKRAVLHSSDHTKIQILCFSAVEFAMNERFMSLNSRSLSMNDVFGLGYR